MKRNIKRLLAAVTTAAIMITATACGKVEEGGVTETSHGKSESSVTSDITSSESEDSKASDSANSENSENSGNSGESKEPEGGNAALGFHAAESTQVFVEGMGVGWNLGNTLDPVNCTWVSNDLDYETAWGNPKTTKELIHYIKSEGFDTVRVPTTWAEHAGDAPNYTIKSEWFDRVQEVVDWCIAEDLYVILNIHHESEWLTGASKDYDNVMAKYKAIWSQIADRFKNYDEHLIFESMNEIGFDDLGTAKGCDLVNKINAEFTDLVRASGGNNDKRYLLLAGYWTDIDRSCEGGITMPDDDRTILSVHYYSPSDFTIADKTSTWGFRETWGTDADFEYLDGQMKKLREHFVDKGTPVIIGEFGSIHTDKDIDDVILFTASVIEYALKYDMCPVWWDNGQEIDRRALAYKVDGMREAVHTATENGFNARNE